MLSELNAKENNSKSPEDAKVEEVTPKQMEKQSDDAAPQHNEDLEREILFANLLFEREISNMEEGIHKYLQRQLQSWGDRE